MKLEVLQENLNHALSSLSRILVSKPQVPILANILLSATDGQLTLTASNLETSLITQIGAKVLVPGEFTVPGKTLFEIIGSLSAQKVQLEMVEGSLKIKSGSFDARINGIVADSYPKLSPQNALQEEVYWEIDRSAFLSALTLTTFAAATDESRAVLTGVLLKPKSQGLTLAATDGFRLSVVQLDKASSNKKDLPPAIIIPARSLSEVSRLLGEKESGDKEKTLKIFISSTENQVYFDLGKTKIFSRLIASNFPDYEKIVPPKSDLKIATTVEELNTVVRLASIFARDSANIVKLQLKNQQLIISATAAQVGENESLLDVSVSGDSKPEDFAIAFNYRYLLDLLAVLDGEIAMEFSGSTAPGVFRSSAVKDFLHIIMPVRVQNQS